LSRRASEHPTDVELHILQVLWSSGPASLGEVCEVLARQRATAKTTVATMLGVMLEKKLVKRADSPRGYVWSAAVNRGTAASGIVAKLLDHIFDGSAKRMVAHLAEKLSDDELEELWRLRKGQQAKKKR
jgi:BlaI family penicillinase repressor